MNLYKKFGITKKGAQPGALMRASGFGQNPALHPKRHDKHEKRFGKHSSSALKGMQEWVDEETKEKKTHPRQEKRFKKCKVCAKYHEKGHKHKKREEKRHEKRHEKKHEEKRHEKNWIQGAIKHPGALHRQLGVKQGNKIPASKLAVAAKKGGTLGRRARMAQTLKGLHK